MDGFFLFFKKKDDFIQKQFLLRKILHKKTVLSTNIVSFLNLKLFE